MKEDYLENISISLSAFLGALLSINPPNACKMLWNAIKNGLGIFFVGSTFPVRQLAYCFLKSWKFCNLSFFHTSHFFIYWPFPCPWRSRLTKDDFIHRQCHYRRWYHSWFFSNFKTIVNYKKKKKGVWEVNDYMWAAA